MADVREYRRTKPLSLFLPLLEDFDGPFDGPVDPAGASAAAARSRRSAGIVALVLLAIAVLTMGYGVTMMAVDDGLTATGVHTTGFITDIHHSGSNKGQDWLGVHYRAGYQAYDERLMVDNARDYHLHDSITVIYDPADPTRFRSPHEANEPHGMVDFMVFIALVAFAMAAYHAVVVVRWHRRIRPLRTTEWRAGKAIRDRRSTFLVDFGDEVVEYRLTKPWRGRLPKWLTTSPVWIGGGDGSLTAVFGAGPYVFATKPS